MTEEWIQVGAVGMVREVHVWTNRPIWPQGLGRPREGMAVPKTLDWDLWLGPAPERPYHTAYHPFAWRGWVDFGTGALGDMACHAFHVVFRALELGHPTRVSASATRVVRHRLANNEGRLSIRNAVIELPETFPHSSIVTWEFPARGSQPAARMHWYDGGVKPPVPVGMPTGQALKGDGMYFVGDKGVLLTGFTRGRTCASARSPGEGLHPARQNKAAWVRATTWSAMDACKGGPGTPASSGLGPC
ncbi:MAG: hypothetical protein U5J83_15695 [Bryobacterales bacterium]|nr:hypothetical protein [Bryobacterales bacterium]